MAERLGGPLTRALLFLASPGDSHYSALLRWTPHRSAALAGPAGPGARCPGPAASPGHRAALVRPVRRRVGGAAALVAAAAGLCRCDGPGRTAAAAAAAPLLAAAPTGQGQTAAQCTAAGAGHLAAAGGSGGPAAAAGRRTHLPDGAGQGSDRSPLQRRGDHRDSGAGGSAPPAGAGAGWGLAAALAALAPYHPAPWPVRPPPWPGAGASGCRPCWRCRSRSTIR